MYLILAHLRDVLEDPSPLSEINLKFQLYHILKEMHTILAQFKLFGLIQANMVRN